MEVRFKEGLSRGNKVVVGGSWWNHHACSCHCRYLPFNQTLPPILQGRAPIQVGLRLWKMELFWVCLLGVVLLVIRAFVTEHSLSHVESRRCSKTSSINKWWHGRNSQLDEVSLFDSPTPLGNINQTIRRLGFHQFVVYSIARFRLVCVHVVLLLCPKKKLIRPLFVPFKCLFSRKRVTVPRKRHPFVLVMVYYSRNECRVACLI